jgi:hypothetical protein
MKKNKIKKELKYHKKWLKSLVKNTIGYESDKVIFEINAEIKQIKWILKMFKKNKK